jgi:hypothetical protein
MITALVVVACFSPTTVCGCSPAPAFTAVVFGTLTTADGAPAAGARLTVRGRRGNCAAGGTETFASQQVPTLDASGRFRMDAYFDYNDTICVSLVAHRNATGVGHSIVVRDRILHATFRVAQDSTRVDLAFP